LWSFTGGEGITDKWIAGNVDEILAVYEQLCGEALCPPMAHQFLGRMGWLPSLPAMLDQPVPLDG
jgi:hypothetical protein